MRQLTEIEARLAQENPAAARRVVARILKRIQDLTEAIVRVMTDPDDPAEQFLAAMMRPRRRAHPRVAEPLRDLDAVEVKTDAGSVAAWRLGEGPAVLLAHGWEDDHSLWTRMILALAERGRAVVALDLPAHGFSDGEACLAPDAARALVATAAQLGPVDAVVAHSFGGPSSALAMTQGLAVERAVFIAAPVGMRRRWGRLAAEWGVSDEIVERARRLYEAREPAAAAFDVREAAKTMTARALFVHAIDDEQVPYAGAEEAAAAWPGAELLLVDGLGHRLIAQDPEIIARIADFVA
ncbi:MAG: alpha/beta fold hydrolase [Hydrogenophilaceae bacterium]|nr:alpha/beta fold hydrolase [Hydrogenophilaceae bacterium]